MGKDLQVKGDNSTMMDLHDHAFSQHPITTMNTQHQAHEDELIHAIRCVKQKDVVMLRILSECVHHIIHQMIVIYLSKMGSTHADTGNEAVQIADVSGTSGVI